MNELLVNQLTALILIVIAYLSWHLSNVDNINRQSPDYIHGDERKNTKTNSFLGQTCLGKDRDKWTESKLSETNR